MNKSPLLLLFAVFFSLVPNFFCQTVFIEAKEIKDMNNKPVKQDVLLNVYFPGQKITPAETKILEKPANYDFYELVDPNGIKIHAAQINIKVNDKVEFTTEDEIRLTLDTPLEMGKIYLLKIKHLDTDGKELPVTWGGKEVPVIRFELNKEPVIAETNKPRDVMKVKSNIALSENDYAVKKTTFKISDDKKNILVETAPIGLKPCKNCLKLGRLDIGFDKSLSEATNHYLTAEVKTESGKSISAKKTVKIIGIPASNPEPNFSIDLSSNFGAGIAPQLNLAASATKLFTNPERKYFIFKPKLSLDLGWGETSSKNAITLESPLFKHNLIVIDPIKSCRPKVAPTIKEGSEIIELTGNDKLIGKNTSIPLNCYSEWRNRNLLGLYSIGVNIGPKFEMDRKFGRINALGTVRFDFNFDRWQHSIDLQRSFLKRDIGKINEYKDNAEEISKDVQIKYGFSITPRIGFEFGRKMTGEVLENDSKSFRFNINPYPIFRSYAGITGVFELNYLNYFPITLTLSEDYYYLGKMETIGEVKDNLLNLRRLKGFHPLGKAVLEIGIGPAKRYSFTTTYENGRAAPSFEYLNIVKTGFKIIY